MTRKLLLYFLSLALIRSASAQPDDSIPFPEVVKKNFAQWDSNGDGVLSVKEIIDAMQSRKITGESAAAIVAIAKIVRGDHYNLPPLTEKFLENSPLKHQGHGDVEADDEDDSGKKAKLNTPPAFQPIYTSRLACIRSTSRELFPQGLPKLEALHQGLGDCTFISSVGAMINRDPVAFKAMFTQNDNGSITVHFGNGEDHKIIITDADIALWTSVKTNGLWMTALEKAYRKALAKTLEQDHTSNQTMHVANEKHPNIYEKFSGPTVEFLTGHETLRLSMENVRNSKTEFASLKRQLINSHKEHLLVKASVGKKTVPGVPGKHAYAVFDFDPDKDIVHLWNPWGNTRTPDGPEGLEHGYRIASGQFQMPLNEFVQVYGAVTFETKKPTRM